MNGINRFNWRNRTPTDAMSCVLKPKGELQTSEVKEVEELPKSPEVELEKEWVN